MRNVKRKTRTFFPISNAANGFIPVYHEPSRMVYTLRNAVKNKAFTVFLMIESFLRKRLSSFAAGARQTGRISRVHHFDYSGGKVGVLPA